MVLLLLLLKQQENKEDNMHVLIFGVTTVTYWTLYTPSVLPLTGEATNKNTGSLIVGR